MTDPAPPVSSALAGVLSSGRVQFNARVAEARHRHPNFDTAAFAGFVRTGLDGVVRAVDAMAPDRTATVVVAAYDIALELVAQGHAGAGARSALVDRAWTELAPRYARLVAGDPFEVLGALSNAVVHLANMPSARVEDWFAGMAMLAPHADSNARFRAFGQVMAWRAGLAHFREGALRCAEALPEPLALLATGAGAQDDWGRMRDAFRADPWWSPQAGLREAARKGVDVGQFTGFGGTFGQPPEIRATPQGFVVRSADRFSLLVADVHGAVLLPAVAGEFANAVPVATGPAFALAGSRLTIGDRAIAIDLPADGLVATGNAHTVAVTSTYSHAIRLWPRA